MITLYGIPNCDTVKKARAWLTAHEQPHVFHDFKKQGVPPEQLASWAQSPGWEKLLNRKGTTWRKLDATALVELAKSGVDDRLGLGDEVVRVVQFEGGR